MKSTKISSKFTTEPGHLSRSIELFRYNIASCEMRYIEHSERVVNLVHMHEQGWHIQGCIPGCGTECDANLTTILLEYLMSCEGSIAREMPEPRHCFSEKVGKPLLAQLRTHHPELSDYELIGTGIDCIVRSLGESGQSHQDADCISVWFSSCPLCVKASECSMQRVVAEAHDLLSDLCRSVVTQLLPEGELTINYSHRDEEDSLEFALELLIS